jgi:hypothetical protein
MITAGTGGAMEPQVKARAGTGWKACATVIFYAEAWQQEGTPAVLVERAFMPFSHLVTNRDRMQG